MRDCFVGRAFQPVPLTTCRSVCSPSLGESYACSLSPRMTRESSKSGFGERAGVRGEAAPPHPNPLPRIGVFQPIRIHRGGEGGKRFPSPTFREHTRPPILSEIDLTRHSGRGNLEACGEPRSASTFTHVESPVTAARTISIASIRLISGGIRIIPALRRH